MYPCAAVHVLRKFAPCQWSRFVVCCSVKRGLICLSAPSLRPAPPPPFPDDLASLQLQRQAPPLAPHQARPVERSNEHILHAEEMEGGARSQQRSVAAMRPVALVVAGLQAVEGLDECFFLKRGCFSSRGGRCFPQGGRLTSPLPGGFFYLSEVVFFEHVEMVNFQ